MAIIDKNDFITNNDDMIIGKENPGNSADTSIRNGMYSQELIEHTIKDGWGDDTDPQPGDA